MSTNVETQSHDPAARDIQRQLISDLLDRLDADEVFDFVVLPMDVLARWWVQRCQPGGEIPTEPHAVWDMVRERYPRAAALPLGPAAERALRRCVRGAVAASPEPSPDVQPGLDRLLVTYVTLLLHEATLYRLRWSNDRLEDDYGFWYHRRPDGSWRSLAEESELRDRLLRASSSHASRLVAAWLGHRPTNSLCPRRRDLNEALGDVLGTMSQAARPGRRRRRRARPLSVLGVDAAGDGRAVAPNARRIVLHGDAATAEVDVDELMAACDGSMHGLLHDLIEIAATAYLADVHVPRNRLFARDLTFLIPVRHPSVWTEHADRLARILGFLTMNTTELHFTAGIGAARVRDAQFRVADDERCVTLFSGGLDSFTGALTDLAEGRRPVLVSHAPSNPLHGIQGELFGELGAPAEHVTAWTRAHGRAPSKGTLGEPPEQVLYQYGRSFLFLSLATSIALERGIGTIHVYENGPVALNPGFSEARFNTRTAHPTFLAEFAELIRSLFDVELRIVNPFELMTKGEAVATQAEALGRPSASPSGGGKALLARTSSCWSWSRVRAWAKGHEVEGFSGGHCGRCIPCIWRRAAVHHAHLDAYDDSYLADSVPRVSREHFTVLEDLTRAYGNALAASDEALLDRCPDLLERGPGTLDERLDMHRRQAREVLTWWETGNPALRLG